jgi:hypothetical protein
MRKVLNELSRIVLDGKNESCILFTLFVPVVCLRQP